MSDLRADQVPRRVHIALVRRKVRKLFVGGVPQGMGEDELQAIFERYAQVERVWLQRHRSEKHHKQHRGFGYVVFRDSGAADRLLGESFSRFLEPGGGVRLEVKRALSSREIQSGVPWSPETDGSLNDLSGVPSPSPEPAEQRRLAWGGDRGLAPYQQHLVVAQVPAFPPSREEALMRTPPQARRAFHAADSGGDAGTPQVFFSPFPTPTYQQQLAPVVQEPARPDTLLALYAAPFGGARALESALRAAMPESYED
ncbi:unnamed protein product [Prorocentrum cordatum]|uniref:RRM domain-containing protein n=2 Tax=Prorocentrum cordatum TaxID=2364126 RepID=A0ABN9SM36_9DINO|nr:unnamed protein product [Polarella glacialis]